ncbi:DNAase [Gordoniibacillus kamchatkensis]|uniref:DNAase n=1 Tax=Gordoniibacillus kamchatkensis TaxID=1590651 RepID=A0ABR5AGQ5_9BACL|nr:TatD family hydrolase [Paenibacillus sp. VKM B-2647]KIL39918.1 DNAase [Paenibacillus sp. VKM B-2647]
MNREIPIIDAHVHLDSYEPLRTEALLHSYGHDGVAGCIAVSMNLPSCQAVESWDRKYPRLVYPAYGYHPEQEPIGGEELEELVAWIRQRAERTIAVGEVGLPYYTRQEAEWRGEQFELAPYVRLLERMIALADELAKPVVLHAVYDDAETVCDMLADYPRVKAHFHWFKGSEAAIQRMIERGCFISVTPDAVYEEEIQQLIGRYPLELMMAETDGPWPFEGPFAGQETRPHMIRATIETIAARKRMPAEEAARILYNNTVRFYGLPLTIR